MSNCDLWEELWGMLGRRQGRLCCVYPRGHIGELGHESADELAEEGRRKNPGRMMYLAEMLPCTALWQRAKPMVALAPDVCSH